MTVEHDAAGGYDVGESGYSRGSGHRGGSGYDARTEPRERIVPERGRSLIDERTDRCPRCAAAVYDDDRYCEACGFSLVGPPVTSGDSDHRETDLGAMAGVSDRGVRHSSNEDAMGVAEVYGTLIAVVCDGVSTTPGSAQASSAAAATATAILADAIRAHGPGRPVPVGRGGRSPSEEMLDVLEPSDDDYGDDPVTVPATMVGGFGPEEAELALHQAVHAAQDVIAELSAAEGRMAPSCTIAAAIISPPTADGPSTVTVGWVGDSRVYLLGPRWSERLTADDTWAAEAARAGLIPASEAETHRRAHTLTRWLGGDAEDVAPHTAVFPIEAPATVLVCSDGLWNYASRPDVMAAIINQLRPEAEAVEVARHLIDFAIDQGGHDNITVVAIRVDR